MFSSAYRHSEAKKSKKDTFPKSGWVLMDSPKYVPLPLSSEQLVFFDYGLKCVPLCQSRFTRQSINEIIEQEYTKLHKRISDNLYNYCITSSDQRAINHFASMRQLLQQFYTTSLSPRLATRAQYNHRMVRSIQHRLQIRSDRCLICYRRWLT